MQRKANADSFKRNKTRHRGVSYRLRGDGSRSYSVHWQGRYLPAGGTEKEALAKQADLRNTVARGGQVILPSKLLFAEFAETWFEQKAPRVRTRTAEYTRSALDLVLIPRFGTWRIQAVDADAVARLTRDLEHEGLHALDLGRPVRPLGASSIDNYLKPLRGILSLAVRRRLVASNPFDVLTSDDRPQRTERKPAREWAPEEVTAVLEASERLAAKPESRHNYTALLRLVACLGLRLGEVLGLRWEDFDKDDGVLHVRRQWCRSGEYGPTKTPAGVRRIALPATIKDELVALRLRSRFSNDEHPIFASQKGTPLQHRNVTRRGWEPAAKAAGLEGVTFHELRHAAASRLINRGLDPVTVASVLGHENANITLGIYGHIYARQRTDEAVRLALAGT
jgi:integrase